MKLYPSSYSFYFLNFKAGVSDICSVMVVNDLSCSTAEEEDYWVIADDILLFSVGHSVMFINLNTLQHPYLSFVIRTELMNT